MIDHKQIERDYSAEGVVRIRKFFTTETVAEIRAELNRYIRDDLPFRPKDARTLEADGITIRNLWRLEQHSDWFRDLGRRNDILSLISKLVGGSPVLTGIETFNKPARIGSGVPWHQDNAYFCQTPPDMLTLWVAIDPVTIENGAVCFVRGSHRAGMLPTRLSGVTGNSIGLAEPPPAQETESFCATLEPGDATIHHCQTIHHSAPNHTDQARLGLLFVYRAEHTRTDPLLNAAYTEAVTATPPA